MRPAIFVSYSHRDAHLVGPVVALLRASEALVFKDSENLLPGKKWREQLHSAIVESKTVVIFWCGHAASSQEVRNEYITARQLGKDLLPILIDGTPLPSELSEYQFIDFRSVFSHGHAGPPGPPVPALGLRRRWVFAGIGGVLGVLVAISAAWVIWAPSSTRQSSTTGQIPLPAASPLLWSLSVAALVFLALVLLARLGTVERSYTRKSLSVRVYRPEHQLIANSLAIELRRRFDANEA